MAKLTEVGLNDGTFTLAVKSVGDNFREDYEIYGAAKGTIHVGYSGSCQACGLSIDFSHEHEIPGVAS